MGVMPPISVLDLAPVPEGTDVGRALRNTIDLAQAADRLGFNRYWLAEHHGMPGIASAATAVLIGQVAAATARIRVGSGGVMLPNHAPLVIAEQFGTLAALFPNRIDLGLGRAPGTDQITSRALRRGTAADADRFPQDVVELQAWLGDAAEGQSVRAVPGEGTKVPIWILGSSTFGAQLAAALGLPYAFASHFAPDQMEPALNLYRSLFRPSEQLAAPYAMVALNVFAADTEAEARLMLSSLQQAFVNLRTGRPGKMPPPVAGYAERLDPEARAMLDRALSCTVVGDREQVRTGLRAFADRWGADELIVSGQIWDHAARVRSFEIVAEAAGLAPAPVAQAA